MSDSGRGVVHCCCNFVITSGFTALFLWLSLRTNKPTCSVTYFYLPALNKSSNSQFNTTIYLKLHLVNNNKDKGVLYDPLNLTIYYNKSKFIPIGNKIHVGFYQGHQKKANKNVTIETYGVDWKAVSGNGSVAVFRVNLVTALRYKILFWYTERRNLKVWRDVEVDDHGDKVNKKGIKLKSGAVPELCGCYSAVVRFFWNVLILIFLHVSATR